MRWLALFLAVLASIGAARAQGGMGPGPGTAHSTSVAYTGPADIIASPVAAYSLRAYKASYATGSNVAINLRRASDSHLCDLLITTAGDLGNTANCGTGGDNGQSAASFAGTDATLNCTISVATATCSGASSTPHVGSTVVGAGVTQPCFVTAVGTFTAGSGTMTVAGIDALGAVPPCGTVSSLTAMTLTYGLYIPKWYDQSQNAAACDAVQATTGAQPQLMLSGGGPSGTFPWVYVPGTAYLKTTCAVSASQPVFVSAVGDTMCTSSGGSACGSLSGAAAWVNVGNTFSDLLVEGTGSGNQVILYTNVGAGNFPATVSFKAWHALQVLANGGGTSSSIIVDGGTPVTGSSSTTTGTGITISAWSDGTNKNLGGYTEVILWKTAPSTGTQNTLNSNQHTYWGF